MKKLLITLSLIFLLSIATHVSAGDDFCEGWADGYIAGYCHGQPYCVEPFVPFCPFPKFGEDDYQGGYNRGFLVGLSDQPGN